jgi:aspartokinase
MEKFLLQLIPSASNPTTEELIRVTDSTPDEDGVLTQNVGFIRLLKGKGAALMAKVETGERILSFGAQNRQTRLFDVIVSHGEPVSAEAPAAEGATLITNK